MNRFQKQLEANGFRLTKDPIEILQVNIGKLCNMTCVHCHVEAGPTKIRENMDRRTAEAVVAYLKNADIKMLDLTGGAPEMNPNFRYLVREARQLGIHVIDRCNLIILFLPGQEDLGRFLADHQVEIIASLPCYLRENVDKQRGRGTFDESIKALLELNQLGYGMGNTELVLNLVYNPVGPHLPPDQYGLEKDYRDRLKEDWGIHFDRLYTITNMPITRYAKYLRAMNQYDSYEQLLINSFNPATLDNLMCRNTLNVGWDGKLYDCDFNQMLGMSIRQAQPFDFAQGGEQAKRVEPDGELVEPQMRNGKPMTIFDVYLWHLEGRAIETANHCFGCTAGCGSSCHGALESKIEKGAG